MYTILVLNNSKVSLKDTIKTKKQQMAHVQANTYKVLLSLCDALGINQTACLTALV